ncbi:MAG: RNA polymerase sigma factor [Solirubrobacterales bacterium]
MAHVNNDSERFEALFNQHHSAILAYVLRRCQTPEEAADVVAETFTTTWRRLDDVPTGERTLPWLYATAKHTLANTRRSAARRDALTERATHELAVAIDAQSESSLEYAPGRTISDAARAALLSLNEGEREVLLLCAWEGLKPREIGRVLGVGSVTARTRLHRARAKFAAALSPIPPVSQMAPVTPQEDSR